ncbi:MAG: hypothetical protein HZC28_04160 [Spirochaetes bacterium]|nr:hypothetical protein [Spirochaetota bacterium]
MNRSKEIRELFTLSVDEMVKECAGHLVVTNTLDELYEYLARSMVDEFARAAREKRMTGYIVPVGPTQPYANMARMINDERVDLSYATFFFMDEYCTDDGALVSTDSPISFRGQVRRIFFDLIDTRLRPADNAVVFPSPENLDRLPAMIAAAGGIEVCYGGIGIHGHLAFNEPAPGIKNTGPRIIEINDFTRTLDASRHSYGGNLINFPRKAITLGMREILGARKLLLMTRNESKDFQWANTALRMAALGAPGDDYPVTHIRGHKNYIVATDRATATAPKIVL